MSKEEKNKANARRISEEVLNKGNMSIINELLAPDFVFHTTPESKGPEGFKQSCTSVRSFAPDYHETIEHIIAEGDMVAVFNTMKGTFTGKLGDTKPTGKKFSVPSVLLIRFKGGKQLESWQFMDSLAWYRQLGIPIPQ
jgi:predicted ester cyclase